MEKKQASSIQDRRCNWTWNVHSLSALLGGNSLILQLGNVIKISSCVKSQGHVHHENGAHSLKRNVDDCLTLQHYMIWGREDIQSSSLRWHHLSWNWNTVFFSLPLDNSTWIDVIWPPVSIMALPSKPTREQQSEDSFLQYICARTELNSRESASKSWSS